MNVPEMSLCVVLRDHPMSWDEETGVSCHTVLILLIIKLSVKENLNFNKLLMLRLLPANLNFNKLLMLRLLPASSYIPYHNFFAIVAK
jgi:hypothetical protein